MKIAKKTRLIFRVDWVGKDIGSMHCKFVSDFR